MISNYCVFGERCSGTNYLVQLITANFDIPLSDAFGHKHFFGHMDLSTANNTLFLGIIRHPICWINSFYKEQHHIPNRPKPLYNFLFDEWYSVNDDDTTIDDDVNYMTKQRYKNIFEMRFYKNYYLLNILPSQAPHAFIITYENLRDNTSYVLNNIAIKFNLTPKMPLYQNIDYYKNTPEVPFIKKQIELPINYIILCVKYLNLQQERRLGYTFKVYPTNTERTPLVINRPMYKRIK